LKIHWSDRFTEGFKRTESSIKDPKSFRKALYKAISILQQGKDLSRTFPVNKLAACGEGWFDCYVYEEIVIIFKIRGQYVTLSRIGTCEELYEDQ
jgi:mRNA-degrading endonuclease YafQ of YafQ-DinJ toxin-antitoxin module